MSVRTKSADLPVGTKLRHRDGQVVTLRRRKVEAEHKVGSDPFWPGWWLKGIGGLADFVIDAENSDWTIVD